MRVLVATDGSECSYAAAREFVQIAGAARHRVTILYVLPLLAVGRAPGYLQTELEGEGISALSTVSSIFHRSGLSADTDMRQGVPADAILQVAREGRFDLIVIGRRGVGGMRELLLGSVSRTIVHKAPCSVLVGGPD